MHKWRNQSVILRMHINLFECAKPINVNGDCKIILREKEKKWWNKNSKNRNLICIFIMNISTNQTQDPLADKIINIYDLPNIQLKLEAPTVKEPEKLSSFFCNSHFTVNISPLTQYYLLITNSMNELYTFKQIYIYFWYHCTDCFVHSYLFF